MKGNQTNERRKKVKEQYMKFYYNFGKPYLKTIDQCLLCVLIDMTQNPKIHKNDGGYFQCTTPYLNENYVTFDDETIKKSFDKLKDYGYINYYLNDAPYARNRFGKPTRWIKITDKCSELVTGADTDTVTNPTTNPTTNPKNPIKSDYILHTTDISISNDIEIEPTAHTPKKAEKHKYGQFNNVLLTDDELQKLKSEYPDWQKKIDNLSYYIGSTGKSYKSHYLTILNWARKDKSQSLFSNQQSPKDLAVFGKKDFTPVPVKNIDYI